MRGQTPTEADGTVPHGARRPGAFRPWLAGGAIGIALAAVLLGGGALAQSGTDESGLEQTFLDRLAGKLGMTTDDLRTTIQQTQVEVVDEAVANGQLTEEQGTELRDRIQSGDGLFRLMPGRHGLGGFGFRDLGINLGTIATKLGMTTDELRTQLESGSTLSDIITAKGSTVEAIVTALVADAQTPLDDAVANGDLTRAQADQILANLPDRLTQMIENGLPAGCDRLFNGDSSDDTDNADETANDV